MPIALHRLLQPLDIPLLVTWGAVAYSLVGIDPAPGWPAWLVMAVFLLAALATRPETGARALVVLVAVQAVCALLLVWLAPDPGTSPVLLVVVAAQLGVLWPLRVCLAVLLLLDIGLYLAVLGVHGHGRALFTVLVFGGFQGFALLVGHYARTAERARDALALVNADLLATRALLADSARDAERLRVARELHDVAGHKLTALKLNLRALAADPTLAARGEVQVAQQLSGELLDDIRGLVQAIRDTRGLDLDTALRALAAPLPQLRLELSIAPAVRITDPAQAETLLRLVQESLTNSARHSGARRVSVSIARRGGALDVAIEDDGRIAGALKEGNGIAGMRERVAAARGRFETGRTPAGGLRILASLPA